MLTRLMNSSARTQRAVALVVSTLSAVIILASIQLLIVGLSSDYANIGEKRALLGRLQAIAAAEAVARVQALPSNSDDPLLLRGDSEAMMTAGLQTWLQEIVDAAGGQINAVNNVSETAEDDIRMIGLKANFSGTMKVIHQTISAIESNQPRLFIKEINVHSNRQQASEADSTVELTATIVFMGAASVQTKP